jgi:FAD dependent oxidoreductase
VRRLGMAAGRRSHRVRARKPPDAAEFTVSETHIGVEARPGADRAEAFPTLSASAATGSTFIPARRDAVTLTSRPIRFRSHWAPCFRRGWTTCWRRANVGRAASVGNRAPTHGGGGSGGVLPLRATTTAADSKRDARAAYKRGVTHVTNGCYRLHPVEWNVGEAAGALAAFGVNNRVSPRAVRNNPALLADFQRTLVSMGVQLHWPAEIQTKVR